MTYLSTYTSNPTTAAKGGVAWGMRDPGLNTFIGLSDCPEWSTYSNFYTFYKIRGVKIEWKPAYFIGTTSTRLM